MTDRNAPRFPSPWTLLACSIVLGAWALMPGAAEAQCCEDWSEPYICTLELAADGEVQSRLTARSSREAVSRVRPSEADRAGDAEWSLQLRPGQTLQVEISALDQYGRPFPSDEIRYRLDSSSCGSLVQVETLTPERFELRAADRNGSCEVGLRVPGNRNLDTGLDLTVSPRARGTMARAPEVADQHAIVASRLYQAVLGREANSAEVAEVARLVGQGQTRDWVRAAFRSEEFTRQSGRLGVDRLLHRLYEGLLQRRPDADGTRTYIPLLSDGKYSEVVMSLLESPEFQQSLREEMMR